MADGGGGGDGGGGSGVGAGSYVPTPLSMQVRALRKGSDRHESVKANMLVAFGSLVERLDGVYATNNAEQTRRSFEERIDFWHRECGMSSALHADMHTLRIWANAARHGDDERWRRQGPRGQEDASQRLAAVESAIEALESSHGARAR